jgi:hypothetical protein
LLFQVFGINIRGRLDLFFDSIDLIVYGLIFFKSSAGDLCPVNGNLRQVRRYLPAKGKISHFVRNDAVELITVFSGVCRNGEIIQLEVTPRLCGGTHNGLTFTAIEQHIATVPRLMERTEASVSFLLPPGFMPFRVEGQDEGVVQGTNAADV